MIVIYAEKPSVAVDIASVIGGCSINGKELTPDTVENFHVKGNYLVCKRNNKTFIVTWGFGHMAQLKMPKEYDEKYKKWDLNNYPFIPEKFNIKLKCNVSEQFNVVSKLFNDPKTEYIICATDYDREGNLIFDYVYRLSKCTKPWKRLIIHSNEKNELLNSFRNLKSSQQVMPVTLAGRCRAIADYLVGINSTVLGSLKYGGYKNIISIGRVQTPTLAMVVDRELEIKNFKSQKYYGIEALFKIDNKSYIGKLINEEGKVLADKNKKLLQVVINELQKTNDIIIENYSKKLSNEKPPLLYDLTSLQMDCNDIYGLTAAKTLELTQSLYEKKLVSYPRTDSRYLPSSKSQNIRGIMDSLNTSYNDFIAKTHVNPNNNRVFDDTKVESHYAIIPTVKTSDPTKLSKEENIVYDLIVRQFLKAFMSNAVWEKVSFNTRVGDKLFISNEKRLVDNGWKIANIVDKENSNKDNPTNVLDIDLYNGLKPTINKLDLVEKTTTPPKRFTEKTLLSAMDTAGKLVEDEELRQTLKDKGIGTPATRADILEKLVRVGYLKREKKSIVPTQKGILIIQNFPVKELKSPKLTGEWEYRLREMEKGKEDFNKFLKDIEDFTIYISNTLKVAEKREIGQVSSQNNIIGKCPKCNGDIIRFITKDKKVFYGCSNYRANNKCNFSISGEICGKKITPVIANKLITNGKTGKLKGFISKKGKAFEAKLVLKDYKIIFEF